uniref:Uncharacterized protein n=1 Tax=Panthera leo TaxID=9689 RepID=A0A8C8XJV2_PANLE
MAEAITYADLRFVKAPLKKSVSSRSGQEADEDEELTYENVQVPSVSVSGGPLSLASSGVGDKADWSSHRSARLQAEQPTASWSSVASPAAGRILTGEYGALPTCAPRPPRAAGLALGHAAGPPAGRSPSLHPPGAAAPGGDSEVKCWRGPSWAGALPGGVRSGTESLPEQPSGLRGQPRDPLPRPFHPQYPHISFPQVDLDPPVSPRYDGPHSYMPVLCLRLRFSPMLPGSAPQSLPAAIPALILEHLPSLPAETHYPTKPTMPAPRPLRDALSHEYHPPSQPLRL